MPKNDSKTWLLDFLKKIMSLVLSGICVKLKFLWFINILQTLHASEKFGSQVIAKNCSWLKKLQYSLIVNILLINKSLTLIFGTIYVNERNERNEWNELKEQSLLTSFLKKLLFGQMGYFGPNIDASSSLWIHIKNLFKVLYNKKDQ